LRPHSGCASVVTTFGGIGRIDADEVGGGADRDAIILKPHQACRAPVIMSRQPTVYLPVSVPGALLSVGDPHATQGDGELGGTAIECSMTGTFQLILHKKADMAGRVFADLTYPLIETATDWVLTGFSHPNYLADFGAKGQSEVYATSSLDLAMKDAFRKMRRFLMNIKGLTEDEAIALMSAAVDFGVTQVVDGNWGVHAILSKRLFEHAPRA
jgi:acetamidase/formamidase